MALSEIEKLERRYAENPQGLTFAPLAEVHRKTGEVQRALDLLGPGLQVHPDYIPASIVLGRCHMDLGNVQAAESAFLHVLALDGENVIALKALADIGERLLKFDEAERWLNALLAVDRSNDEAREQLQRVEISRRQAEVASSAEPSSVGEPSTASFEPPTADPAVGWVSQSSQAGATREMGTEDLEPSALLEPFADPSEVRFEEPATGELDEPGGLQFDEPVLLDETPLVESVEPLEGLVGRELDGPVREGADAFRVETSEDIVLESAGGGEFQMPDASQELFAAGAGAVRAPFEEDAPVGRGAGWETPQAEPAEPAADIGESEAQAPAPFVYEPPAEPAPATYAAGPYEAEPERKPSTPEPVASELAPLEATPESEVPEVAVPERAVSEPAGSEPAVSEPAVSEPAMPEFAASELAASELAEPEPATPEAVRSVPSDFRAQRRDEEDRVPAAPPRRSYDAGETGGRSVAQLFKGILSSRPPAQASAAAVRQMPAAGSAGAPTRPAADALSLSSVFGEDASATPPAVPASNQGAGSVSFDDFFSSPSGSPASRTPRAPDPKNDDLDQFHAWLQNLKR